MPFKTKLDNTPAPMGFLDTLKNNFKQKWHATFDSPPEEPTPPPPIEASSPTPVSSDEPDTWWGGYMKGVMPTLRNTAAMATRTGSGYLGSTLAVEPGAGTAAGALIGGAGESAAEWMEGSEQSPARIATEAALTAIPLSKVFRAGRPVVSALRGATLQGVQTVGRQLSEGESPHIGWSEGAQIAGAGALGGLLGMGGKGKVPEAPSGASTKPTTTPKPPTPPAPKTFEVEPTAHIGGRIKTENGWETVRAPRPVTTQLSGPNRTTVRGPVRSFMDEVRAIPYKGKPGHPIPPEPVSTGPTAPYSAEQPQAYRPAAKAAMKAEGAAYDQAAALDAGADKATKAAEKATADAERKVANDDRLAKIRQRRADMGLKAQDPTFNESLSAKNEQGGSESMSTRYGDEKTAEENLTPKQLRERLEAAQQDNLTLKSLISGEHLPPTEGGGAVQVEPTTPPPPSPNGDLGAMLTPPVDPTPLPPAEGPTLFQGDTGTTPPRPPTTVMSYDAHVADLTSKGYTLDEAEQLASSRAVEGYKSSTSPEGPTTTPTEPTTAPSGPIDVQARRIADAKARFSPEVNAQLDELGAKYRAATGPEKRGLGAQMSAIRKAEEARLAGDGPPASTNFMDQLRASVAAKEKPVDMTGGIEQFDEPGVMTTPEGHQRFVNPEDRALMSKEDISRGYDDIRELKRSAKERIRGRVKHWNETHVNEDQQYYEALKQRLEAERGGPWEPEEYVSHEAAEHQEPMPPMEPAGSPPATADDSPVQTILKTVGIPADIADEVTAGHMSAGEKISAIGSALYKRLPNIARFNYLSSGSGMVRNAFTDPYGSAIIGSLEHAVAGLATGDRRGWEALKKLKNPFEFARRYHAALDEAREAVEEGHMGRAEHYGGRSTPAEKLLSLPAVHMTAGDLAGTGLLQEVGFSKEEARRIMLTSEPGKAGGDLGKTMHQLQNVGQGTTLGSLMFPFKRTLLNITEQGSQRLPGLGLLFQRGMEHPDSRALQMAQQGIGVGAGGLGYVLGSAGLVDPRSTTGKFLTGAAGGYGMEMGLGLSAGAANATGQPFNKQAEVGIKNAIQNVPLPTMAPLTDLANLVGKGKVPNSMYPGILREFGIGQKPPPKTIRHAFKTRFD